MKQIIKTILFSTIAMTITLLLFKFPSQSLEASLRGLNIWWEIVFPSLLPFFIIAELLIGFGVVTFIGVLFEPIMRPLFNVPGAGSFAWMMGMASGYPAGAKISVLLYEQRKINQYEAERLISFTNAASPLFIFGAIAVGFFYDAKIGLLIAVCHYLGNLFVGICMGFHGKLKDKRETDVKRHYSFLTALREMHRARMNDPRPLGELLGDSVLNSVKTLVIVGGFIIFFSVLTSLLYLVGLTPLVSNFLQFILQKLGLPHELSLPLLTGFFEITLGAQLMSESNVQSILSQLILVSFILGFNGFSIQAQVASIIAKTNIRFSPYFFARILHGVFSSVLTIILFKPLYIKRAFMKDSNIPVFHQLENNSWLKIIESIKQFGPMITFCSLIIATIILYRKTFHQINQ